MQSAFSGSNRTFRFGMGSFRFLLSFLVVASHTWVNMVHGYAAYAVWAFYVLSGYLMTLVLREKYGFSVEGLLRYVHNRVVRIYPSYYACLAIGVLTVIIARKHHFDTTSLNPQFYNPTVEGWLNPLTLLSFFPTTGLPVAVSGALATEVTAYLFLPLMASSPIIAVLFIVISFTYNLAYGLGLDSFAIRYSSFSTCLLAFAWGSLSCHFSGRMTRIRAPMLSLSVWMIFSGSIVYFPYIPWTYGLYISLPISSWVVISLVNRKSTTLDRFLGDMSYPVYLLHTIAYAFMAMYFGKIGSFETFIMTLIVTVMMSFITLYIIDKPMMALRWSTMPKFSSVLKL